MFASLITERMFYLIAILAVIFLGLSKGGLSALGTGATPLLALYLPPLEAAALLLPILLTQDVISIYVTGANGMRGILRSCCPGRGSAWAPVGYLRPMYPTTQFAS